MGQLRKVAAAWGWGLRRFCCRTGRQHDKAEIRGAACPVLFPADVDWVSGVQWGYCVLDEGHAIRNPTSKVTQVRPAAALPPMRPYSLPRHTGV